MDAEKSINNLTNTTDSKKNNTWQKTNVYSSKCQKRGCMITDDLYNADKPFRIKAERFVSLKTKALQSLSESEKTELLLENEIRLAELELRLKTIENSKKKPDQIQTETNLRISEERWKFALESSTDGVWDWDVLNNEIYFSPRWKEMLGYAVNEISNNVDEWTSRVHPDDLDEAERAVEDCLQGKTDIYKSEHRLMCKDGSYKWILDEGKVVSRDQNGVTIRFIGTHKDITARKVAEQELLDSKKKYQTLVETISDAIFEVNEVGTVIYTSPSIYQILEYTPEEIIGRNFIEFVYEDDRATIIDRFKNLATKDYEYMVYRYKSKSGSVRWVRTSTNPIFEDGKLTGGAGSLTNITKQKEIETALKNSEALYRSFMNASPDTLTIADLDGSITFTSPRTYSMFGYEMNENLIGRSLFEFIAPSDLQRAKELMQRMFEGEYGFGSEYKGIKSNGELFDIEVIGGFIHDAEGNKTSLIFNTRDITVRKAAERELTQKTHLLTNLLTNLEEGILLEDVDRKILITNELFCGMFGIPVPPADLVGADCTGSAEQSKHLMKNPEFFVSRLGTILKNKKLVLNEELEMADGRFLERDYIPTYLNEKYNGHLWKYRDITKRKLAEKQIIDLNSNLETKIVERTAELEEINQNLLHEIQNRKNIEYSLSESEKNYRTVVENVNEVIFQTDAQGLWLFLNRSWEEITGFTIDESIGQLFLNYVHPDDRQRNNELFAPLINRQKEYCRHTVRYLTKDGGFRWIEVFARLGLNENDEIVGTYGTLQDVTERKQSEEALLWNQTLLQLMANSSPLGFLVVDNRTDEILYFNERFCNIWGIEHLKDKMYSGELKNNDIIPDCLPVLTDIPAFAESCKPLQDEHNRVVVSDEIAFTENRTIHRFSTQIRGENDQYYGRFYIFEDITEQRRAEEFEKELLQLSTKLTGISLGEIEIAINLALSRIGKFLGADRSYIFEIDALQYTMSNTYEWCNEDIRPEIENLKDVPCDVFPMWMELLEQHKNVIIPSVKNLPESWQTIREVLEPQGIKSLIVIPLIIENHLVGFVGLDAVTHERSYTSAEINILKVWGSMLSSLLSNQRTERLLEQTRLNYETFFNTIDDFLFVLDEQGKIIHTNTTVNKRLNFTKDELINQSVLMLHPENRRDEAGRIVGEMLTGTTDYCPVPLVNKAGDQLPVETRVKRGFWDGESVIFGVSKDISKIKLSEQKFASAFHVNSAMMGITDFETGRFLEVNQVFLDTLGYTREEVIGKNEQELNLYQSAEARQRLIDNLSADRRISKFEHITMTKSGNPIYGIFSAEPIYIGKDLCLMTVMVDITERKKIEIDLENARKEAENANLAKSEFLSRMSHELRTPMNSILGFAQLLDLGVLTSGQKRGVSHILRSGNHLLDLINEILDLSRIEAGRMSLVWESVNVTKIIDETIDVIMPLASTRQIKVKVKGLENKQMFVNADKKRMKQVLLNLLNNAVKYNTEGGTITVKTELIENHELENIFIRISIVDTGLGISNSNISKLFIPFERINADDSCIEGTGLGLAVVKKLMDAMSGNIGVTSEYTMGSTFWIELPLVMGYPDRDTKDHGSQTDPKVVTAKTGKILYIEDNLSNIELVEEILEHHRPAIELMSSMYGRYAHHISSVHKPNLILLDLNLPDIHGSEVIELLKGNEQTKDIPIVILSADAMTHQIESVLKSGANEFITKPIDINTFLDTVDRYF